MADQPMNAPDALSSIEAEAGKLAEALGGIDPDATAAATGAKQALSAIRTELNSIDGSVRSAFADAFTPPEGQQVRANERLDQAQAKIQEQLGNLRVSHDTLAQRLEEAALPRPSTASPAEQMALRDELKMVLDAVRDPGQLSRTMAAVALEREDLGRILTTPWALSYARSRGAEQAYRAARGLMLQDAASGKLGESRRRAAQALAQIDRLAFLSQAAATSAQGHLQDVRRRRQVRQPADAPPPSDAALQLQAAAAQRRGQR